MAKRPYVSRAPAWSPRLIRRGMKVYDANAQRIGEVILKRREHFVFRQDVVIPQLVAVPTAAIATVKPRSVFLTLTPGQIELVCETRECEEKERVA